ncbi:phage portal protein, partial [Myxococcus sp. AM011]|nr:phage portal protein [Myxococcus sp. AM011]
MPPLGPGGPCAERRQSLRPLLSLGRATPRAGVHRRGLHPRRTPGGAPRRAGGPWPARARRLSHPHGPPGLRGGPSVTVPAEVHQAEERLQSILKAVVVGARVDEPASRPGGEDALAFSEAGALQPPYEPEALCLLVEHSNSLRQNVDAYATNIDGFGYRFEPAIDFDADGAREKVADAMALERAAAHDAGTLPAGTPLRPTAEEVAAHAEEVRQQARVEKARLESFFDFCCFDGSFVELRRRTRHDVEVTGNAYWEVLRDGKGDIARFVYVPSYTVRLLPLDKEAVEVRERVRISAVSFDTVSTRRRLRRYLQVQGSERVYFKSFGD